MKYPIFDGHCDTALRFFHRGLPTFGTPGAHVTLPAMAALPRYAQFFAFCTVCYPTRLTPPELFRQALGDFTSQLETHGEQMTLCTDRTGLDRAWQQGKTAAFLALEGAEAMDCDPGRMEEMAALGITMIAPAWNYENALSGTNQTGGGLTAAGREFVRRAGEWGIILDVSHISDRAFFEICELAEGPVVASHSNSRTLCPHPRNLTDDQFRCLRDRGGTVGLNLYAGFLRQEGPANLEDVRRHLEHFLSMDGEKTVALGGDLDGISAWPEGFHGLESYRDLFALLEAHGYGTSLLEALGAGNLARVLKE